MAIDLLHDDPAWLIDADEDELLAAVRAIEHWTERHAEVLDYVYAGQTARLLALRASADDLRRTHDHIRRAAALARDAGIDASWQGRWRGIAAVLDARLGVLARRDAAGQPNRAHFDRVLAYLAGRGDAGAGQSEIGEALGLRKANLSRVLNLMEADDLVARRMVGREKKVVRGPAAPVPEAALAAKRAEPTTQWRGMDCLKVS